MQQLINKLAEFRGKALQNRLGITEAQANEMVQNELLAYQTNNPNTSFTSGSASEMIPTAVMLNDVVETAPKGRWSYINGLIAGKHTLQSKNNEYPIIGDINYANGGTEWQGATGFYSGKEGTESLNSGKVTITPKQLYASYGISRELDQYSMVDLIPLALKRLMESMLFSVAVSVMNGDSDATTANINCKGVLPATFFASNGGLLNANVLHNNGLRDSTLAGATGTTKIDVGTPAGADDIFDAMKIISFGGGTPDDYIIVMNNKTYWTYMKHADFKEAYKNWVGSTITTGAISVIAGIELFVTDEIVLPLTGTDGKVDGSTPANNVKGSFMITKRNTIQHGFFGAIDFDVKYDIQKGVLVESVAYFGFDNIATDWGRNEAVYGFNIDIA